MKIRTILSPMLFCLTAMAEDVTISGPTMGLVYSGSGIRPIFGIPGAAYVGSALPLDFTPESVAIAPERSYALAISAGKLVLIDASRGKLAVHEVDDVTDAARVWFSPAGKSALILSKDGLRAQLLTGLPERPQASGRLILSDTVVIAAISEDARFALTASDSGIVTQWDGDGNLRGSLTLGDIASLQFYNRSGDALAASRSSKKLFKIRESGEALLIHEIDAIAAATSSDDTIVYAVSADGPIQAMRDNGDPAGGFHSPIQATRFQRMGGVLLLNEYGNGPLAVFDGSQVLLIPPAKDGGVQ